MSDFRETTYLSEIIEESSKNPVIIFKYSNSCGTSTRLKSEFEQSIDKKVIHFPVYLVTVQVQKSLSKQIEEYFKIRHESPQVIILSRGKVTYSANHTFIKLGDFIYK